MGLWTTIRRRIWPHGPAFTVIASVVAVFALGISAVGLAFLNPQHGTTIGQEYAAAQVYAFDRLLLRTSYLELDVEAGFLVPVMSRSETSGVVVFGLGWASLDLPADLAAELGQVLGAEQFREDFAAIYLPATYQSLARLRRLCLAREVEDPEYLALTQDLLDQHAEDPGLLPSFQSPVAAAPVESPSAVRLYTVTYGRVDYLEGPRIVLDLSRPLSRRLSFPNPDQTAPAFPQLYTKRLTPLALLLYVLLGGLLVLLCLVLTLHLREPEWAARSASGGSGLPLNARLGMKMSYAPLSGPLAVLGVMLVHRGLGAGLLGKSYPPWLGEALLGVAVACWAVRRRVPARHLGLTSWALPTAIGAGSVVGFYAMVAGSTGYPSGVRLVPWEESALMAARVLLVGAPLRELALRGFVQTSLERYAGRVASILLPAAAAGASYLLGTAVLFGRSHLYGPLLAEGLLLVPVAHALAGYLYQRTRNLAAPVLVTGLVEILPKILAF